MATIKEIEDFNKKYEEKKEELNKLYKELKEIANKINLQEVESDLTYSEAKKLYRSIILKVNNKELVKTFEDILKAKKEKEYPEIKKVHYYPVLKELSLLNKKEQIELDNLLMEAYTKLKYKLKINSLKEAVKCFLIDKKIIEKKYIFKCTCGSLECDERSFTEKEVIELKEYWEKEKNNVEISNEDDKRLHYGCFEVNCWYNGSKEISSLEEFEDNLSGISYRVLVKPDKTLDNL